MSKELPLVYVVGDSISIQYGPYLEKALRGFFRFKRKGGEGEALLNLDQPAGANAGDSRMTLAYLSTLVCRADFECDVLMLNCGLHDIKRSPKNRDIQIPLDEYRSNLEQIVHLCVLNDIRFIWLRTTPVVDAIHNHPKMNFHRHAEDLNAYNDCADSVMERADAAAIDLFRFTRNLGADDELFIDHVHYLEAIREKQGLFLAGSLCGWLNRI
ncbi:SGNH/GDSL hydrolase family protein [Cerasicoccus arenae]|uniref:SGNH/GDSL hydrolase family protein n=1 Tax=Cerasicoccus arenae TaxID=424488 RepID=A0A8J3DG44_9BACT|nr:SGNH/GDSL hydrolase family protein [Cerasicoccus arenae]MBK1859247.1 SGNH/GDSL hydrolase family protein [Cerasicoccus arenae]GHC02850.1 hypothetical protein GCM10007047_19420 [Cerasicoccus arenae]